MELPQKQMQRHSAIKLSRIPAGCLSAIREDERQGVWGDLLLLSLCWKFAILKRALPLKEQYGRISRF
jgi:hypothetical protein